MHWTIDSRSCGLYWSGDCVSLEPYGLGIQQEVGPCGNRVWFHTGGVPGYTSVAAVGDTGERTGVLLIPSDVETQARHAATQRLLDAILCAMDDKPAPGHG